MIKVSELKKTIGKKIILDNINLNVKHGSICGIVGRNGAGKTSFLKCLMGLWNFDYGKIHMKNIDVKTNSQFKKFTVFIPDEINIPNNYKVKDAEIFYKHAFENFDTDYFYKLLNLYEISINENIGNLSKGIKLKLSIALNISRKPDLLILDEPLSNLDPVSRKELINILISCASDKKMTILISTHNILDVQKFCDSFVILDEGKVLYSGSYEYLKNKIIMARCVLKSDIPDKLSELKGIIEYKIMGKSVTIVLENNDGNLDAIKKLSGDFELINLDLEEIIVYMLGGKTLEKLI
ncbi:MAG: ABC transporter ATP-binding protein [Clostridiales bacterium]